MTDPIASTMRAARIHEYGGIESVRVEAIPVPVPGPGETLVRVHAASVNPVDWEFSEGVWRELMPRTLPTTLGFDLSGVVAATGPGETKFAVGEAVYAQTDYMFDGPMADYMRIKTERLAAKPVNLDHVQAAAVPVGAMAAYAGLFAADAIDLQPGQRVLITAAAGGVGIYAVQMAKWRGAHVIGTGSPHNEAFLRELGVDEFIDYHVQALPDAVAPVDAVLEAIGKETQAQALRVIKPGGMLASLVGDQFSGVDAGHDVRKHIVRGGFTFADLPKITALIEQGHVKPILADILPIDEVRTALAKNKTGHVRGKIVLTLV